MCNERARRSATTIVTMASASGERMRWPATISFHFLHSLCFKFLQLMSLLAYLCFNNLVDTSRYFCNTYISMANNWCFRRILSGGKQVVVMSVSRGLRLPEEICGPRYKGSTLLPGLAKPKRVHLMKVPVIQLWWRITCVICLYEPMYFECNCNLKRCPQRKNSMKRNYFDICCKNLSVVFTCMIVSCLFLILYPNRSRYFLLHFFVLI